MGDDLDWMEGYVGLVGSSLATDVVQRTVGVLNQSSLSIWINPVWPWGNNTVLNDITFIHARIEQGGKFTGRRLLWSSAGAKRRLEHNGLMRLYVAWILTQVFLLFRSM